MSTGTRVAIVCPCYNAGRFVGETIASVRAQTWSSWTLTVVDDGSSDDSVAVAREAGGQDARVSVVAQANAGVAAARNAGVTHGVADADYILFLDADDRLHPTMLDRLVTYLDRTPEASAAYAGWRYIDDDGAAIEPESAVLLPRLRPTRFGVAPIPDSEPVTPFSAIFCAAGMTPSLTVIRRAAFEATGGWDETFGQPAEDTHLFLQLALLGPIHFVSDVLVDYRVHSSQSTNDPGRLGRQWTKLLDRWADLDALDPARRDTVRRAWLFRERNYAAVNGAWRFGFELRRGRPIAALRFAGGTGRLVARSLWTGAPVEGGR